MINNISFGSIKTRKNFDFSKKESNKDNSKAKTKAAVMLGLVGAGAIMAVCIKKRHKLPKNPKGIFRVTPLLIEDKHSNINFKNMITPPIKAKYEPKPVYLLEDKHNDIKNAAIKVKQTAPLFLTPDNKPALGVKLKGGMAFKNRKPFNGTLKVTKGDNDFEILYDKGRMTKSFKNGKLFREYSKIKTEGRINGANTTIYLKSATTYDDNGEIIRKRFLNYGHTPFERAKRTILWDYQNNSVSAMDFDSMGRLRKESLYSSPANPYLVEQKSYDEQRNLVSTLKNVERNIFKKTDNNTKQSSFVRANNPITDSFDVTSDLKTYPAIIRNVEKFTQSARKKISGLF